MGDVSRVLLPLDGSTETASAVADMARRAVAAGASVAAVHVFDAANAPAFWDQAAHGHTSWSREFLDRHHLDGVELDLRRGRPAEEVLAGAEQWGADLIVMAWDHDLGAGHARTVRRAVTQGTVPVLLVSADPGPRPDDPGPSALPGAARPRLNCRHEQLLGRPRPRLRPRPAPYLPNVRHRPRSGPLRDRGGVLLLRVRAVLAPRARRAGARRSRTGTRGADRGQGPPPGT